MHIIKLSSSKSCSSSSSECCRVAKREPIRLRCRTPIKCELFCIVCVLLTFTHLVSSRSASPSSPAYSAGASPYATPLPSSAQPSPAHFPASLPPPARSGSVGKVRPLPGPRMIPANPAAAKRVGQSEESSPRSKKRPKGSKDDESATNGHERFDPSEPPSPANGISTPYAVSTSLSCNLMLHLTHFWLSFSATGATIVSPESVTLPGPARYDISRPGCENVSACFGIDGRSTPAASQPLRGPTTTEWCRRD